MEEDKEFNTVQRASEGDPEAFRELVERYGDRIFSLLTGITGNRLDAEELTSDVFPIWTGSAGSAVSPPGSTG